MYISPAAFQHHFLYARGSGSQACSESVTLLLLSLWQPYGGTLASTKLGTP